MKIAAAVNRYPSCKKPRLYQAHSETFAEAVRRWHPRYAAYRDACVIHDCMYQASVCRNISYIHKFRAFYGVEGQFIN